MVERPRPVKRHTTGSRASKRGASGSGGAGGEVGRQLDPDWGRFEKFEDGRAITTK